MINEDVAIIQRILADDETAFAELVKKYQKAVHTLAWRKIGDFHIAEDITQDAFLKVYQKLHTLQDPNQFAGWLYVITTNLCSTWLRKKRIQTKRLEDAETMMAQRDAYSEHVTGDSTKTAVETQREVVKKLLAKLKESERTVMSLHYLGEMKIEEISRFLGVSTSTIKSRLRRARNRLQKEETMIKEALEHFQLSPNLTENIMQEVSRLKPTPTASKPLVPWAIAATSAVLIVLLLGIGSQQLFRFQQPFSLDAQAEMTVELVDTPIVLNLDAKPDVRNQLGSINPAGDSENEGQKPDEVLLAAAETDEDDKVSNPKQQWIQAKPTTGTMVEGLLATSEDVLYTLAQGHIYKLQDDSTGWQHVSDVSSITDVPLIEIPMAERNNTFYMVPSNKLYASIDDCRTWDLVHQFPDEYYSPTQLLLTEKTIYIIFEHPNGAFRSEDKGKTWKDMSGEFPNEPDAIVTVQDTVFALAGNIYRWNSGGWQRLAEFPVPQAKSCYSITVTKDKLYAFTINAHFDPDNAAKGQRGWWIFRSTDLGNSWENITPTQVWKSREGWRINIRLVAAGETLLALEQGLLRSTDGGDTWMPLEKIGKSLEMFSNSPIAVLNESIFYFGSPYSGLQRSIDEGKSWEVVNVTSNTRGIGNLIVDRVNEKGQNTLPIIYGNVGDMVKTIDKGKSWKTIPIDLSMDPPNDEDFLDITQIIESKGIIYAKGTNFLIGAYDQGVTHIFHMSTESNMLVPIQDLPIIDPWLGSQLSQRKHDLSDKAFVEQLQERFAGATQFFIQLVQMAPIQQENLRRIGLRGAFAVSDDTVYMEYNFKLFRWKQGEKEWYDTGLEETVELKIDVARIPLKLATSGDTVYVGKRDGHLAVSFDSGNNWIDLTPALPFVVKVFKDIVVAGSTVYVATNAGIITSDDGRNWRTITDAEGTNLSMDILTADGTMLYGVIKDTGIYRLENGTWNQIVSEMPENIISLAVDGNTLYVGTQDQGMLHFNLSK